jgi:PKD repeat protein
LVCVSNEDQTVYGVAYTDASGNAQVLFDGPVQDPGTAKVTVTYHNHLPYQADIQVIPQSGPYVIKDTYDLNDATGGNGNAMMDYGESIMLSLGVKNVGIAQATNVVVTLSTTDPYITFTDDTEPYGTVDPDEVVYINDGFAFDVSNDIPDGHYVLIDVEASGDGDEIWTSNFSIEGHAPVLEMGLVTISDPTGNNNGKVDPGETVELSIEVENTGSSEAFNILGILSVVDPYLTIDTDEADYGDIAAGEIGAGTFTATAAINTPAGHLAEPTLNISADLGITGNGTFQVVIGQIPVLILDLDGNHNSAPEMETCLQDMDVAFETLTAFPSDLNLYSTIFVCLGIYSSNHVLSSAEGQVLADYLNNGGSLYMEGGDTWYYDSQTAVHSMFNINGVSDGSADMSTVVGQTGTFTEGMSFNYSGDNSWMDHIEPVSPAIMILENQSPSYGTGVAYDGGTYRTIGTSHEFGGLDDGASPSTKNELMVAYLEFLGISQVLQASFASSTTYACNEEIINYYDQSSGGGIISWDWTFEGGSPPTSSNQNPLVVYFNPGVYDVTLTISDGVESSTITMEDYMTVVETPAPPATPTGDEEVCSNFTATSEYETTGSMYADNYVWEILPAEAGSILGDGTTGTVEWTTNWEGTASIKVKGMNDACGEGGFSEVIEVVCSICTGIDEYGDKAGILVYPNPNNGLFNVKFEKNIGQTHVTVVNVLNEVLFEQSTETMNGNQIQFDLSDFSRGVYFVRIKTESSEQVRKIIIQ